MRIYFSTTIALGRENYAVSIFFDLSKAFDTVNHTMFYCQKSLCVTSTPLKIAGLSHMAAVPLFRYTKMASVTSRENTLYANDIDSDLLTIHIT